jgi:2,4-dienoyl-CoA reductase-like NADH-dependent reductase (Old Yellow Enzyme family)
MVYCPAHPAPTGRIMQTVTIGSNSDRPLTVHRVAKAPLSRFRNDPDTLAPTDMAVEYYGQRANKGGLMTTESTVVSEEAEGYSNAPGIYSEEHVRRFRGDDEVVHDVRVSY